ncbi:MAG: UDP-3-O-(3-hydroxymyristoyl)glucosamine N-acyltransferase [Pseudomonadota bacterium]
MRHTIQEIAEALGAEAFGDLGLLVSGAAEPAEAGPDDLALAMKPEFAAGLASGDARAAVIWDGADWQSMGLQAAIVAPRSRYALSGLTRLLDPGPDIPLGIHSTAIVDPSAQIGDGAAIGPFTLIHADAEIGPCARIASHVVIGAGARIGKEALILEGAKIGARVAIGDRFIGHPGIAIGADGFSFVTPEKSGVERARESLGDQGAITAQSWTRIHSLGAVSIADDVEIGGNTVIDRGTIRDTRIGRGTKLDNLVHMGHNVEVGEDCLLCGQVGIAGSAKIGDRVVMGGQCGVSDNIFIGDDVVAGGATKMYTNVPAGRVVLGSPAVKMENHVEMMKALRRLPRLAAELRALQKAISNREPSD